MEVGSGNDNTVDSIVSPDDAVDLDLPVSPRSTEVPIFQSKMKEKAKVTDCSHDPELEADTIAGSKPTTALSGAGLCSVETEQDVDRDDVVREISVFCGSGDFGEGNQSPENLYYGTTNARLREVFGRELRARGDREAATGAQSRVKAESGVVWKQRRKQSPKGFARWAFNNARKESIEELS
ncbi:hypothetical protein MA16_Dca018765 [Dendrobium catenatum]|uniref:Uncharacterized protein n=1 Tax=Dendrobium catenatum TaxID=906689 RepID=A0A2I0WVV1_9ASPA|nr:hypothetical protein MA16_Dca018765 [Dendrobium catenatum]